MLKDWSGMDKEKAKEYILKCQVSAWENIQKRSLIVIYLCKFSIYYLTVPNVFRFSLQSYDGGFGLVPGSESHGKHIFY